MAKSPLRRVLDELKGRELVEIADHFGLPTGGGKSKVANRIAVHVRRDLVELIEAGPWSSHQWNDVVAELGGRRRRALEDIAAELQRVVDRGGRAEIEFLDTYGDMTVKNVRRDPDALEELMDLLDVEDARVMRTALDGFRSGSLLRNVLDALRRDLAGTPSASSSPAAKAAPGVECPRCGARNPASFKFCGSCGDGLAGGSAAVRVLPSPAPIAAPTVSTRSRDLPSSGDVLGGKWRIRHSLGAGGFGYAYEVEDVTGRVPGLRVAKLPKDPDDPSLANEIAKAQSAVHKSICQVHDFQEDPRFGPWLLIQHGGTSVKQFYEHEPATWEEAMRVARGAAVGLDFLHGERIVHGDVSPGNILVDGAGVVRLTDFGISAALRHTQVGGRTTALATSLRGHHPVYAAEEVLRGEGARPASDQSSLALVICALLQGVEAFEERRDLSPASAPATARFALQRALHPVPAHRFRTCGDLVQALEGR